MDGGGPRAEEIIPAERASVYVDAIKRRWWLVVGLAALAGAVAFSVNSNKPKQYDASARVLLDGNAEPVNVLQHATPPQSFDPERTLNTAIALVKLDSSAAHVRKKLKLRRLTAAQLLTKVSAAPEGTTNIVAITARDESPERAAAIANAFAARYVWKLRRQAQDTYREAAQLAQGQLRSLSPAQEQGARGATLRQELHRLQVAGALQTGGAELIDRASVPTTAASPRPLFATVVGMFLGTLLGGLAAISLAAAERRRSGAPAAAPLASLELRERVEQQLRGAQPTRAVGD